MTDPRIAVLAALSSPDWHPVPEAHGMPWREAEELLAAYDASRAAVPSAPADRAALVEGVSAALEHGSVRCPLCPDRLVLHTPDGARAHFTVVHPEQQITGRGAGPWPMLVDRAGLRDRIAEGLLDHLSRTADIRRGDDGELAFMPVVTDAERMRLADAVLAVLPACPDPIECGHEAALGEAQQQVRRLGLMVDEYGAGASALTGKLKQLRDIGHRLAAHAVGFQDVLDESDRGPWARTVGADIAELCEVLDAPAAAVLPASDDRAALLREVADECDKAGAAYAARAQNEHAAGAFTLMETFLRKANEAEHVATPCDFMACEPGGEPCSTHERLMAHAEDDHELCTPDCGTTEGIAERIAAKRQEEPFVQLAEAWSSNGPLLDDAQPAVGAQQPKEAGL